ncbi:Nn.00g059470.m01.CDS01 [Neocucurbitaria sp. VM-36]
MNITSGIDVATPPEVVRAKFLDLESLPRYRQAFFGSINPLAPTKSLEPGHKVRVAFSAVGQNKDAEILANTPSQFQWCGSIALIFTGNHSFKFEPSTSIPSGTNFTQEEVFSGALAFLMGENLVARQFRFAARTVKGWEGFNRDMKAWCETE